MNDDHDKIHPTEQYHPHAKPDGHGPLMLFALIAAIVLGSYWGFKSARFGWFDQDPRERYECPDPRDRLNVQLYATLIADKNQTPFAVPQAQFEIPKAVGQYRVCAELSLEGVKPGVVTCEGKIEVGE